MAHRITISMLAILQKLIRQTHRDKYLLNNLGFLKPEMEAMQF
jgi:hypothetical protein